jgi:hypothetical protein
VPEPIAWLSVIGGSQAYKACGIASRESYDVFEGRLQRPRAQDRKAHEKAKTEKAGYRAYENPAIEAAQPDPAMIPGGNCLKTAFQPA